MRAGIWRLSRGALSLGTLSFRTLSLGALSLGALSLGALSSCGDSSETHSDAEDERKVQAEEAQDGGGSSDTTRSDDDDADHADDDGSPSGADDSTDGKGSDDDGAAGQGDDDAADGDDDADDDTAGNGASERHRIPSTTTRRLSVVELESSYRALFGFVPAAVQSIPPDGLGHAFDRVVNGQTVSRAHLDAFAASAGEIASTLLSEARLDDVVESCADSILPPAAPESTVHIVGAAFSVGPEWAVGTDGPADVASLLYAPEPTAAYSHSFVAKGRYEVALQVESSNQAVDAVDLTLDDQAVATFDGFLGPETLTATVDVEAASPAVLTYQFYSGDNLGLDIIALQVRGPIDTAAAGNDAARSTCAADLISELGPQVYRRPLTSDEQTRLTELYEATERAEGFGVGLSVVLQALLTSPHFLYLVELGKPVAEDAGAFELDSFEMASRLSYALCESPPDKKLREAALNDQLQTAQQVGAQVDRLMGQECSRVTLNRFFEHWLGLDQLADLDKSPETYPDFTDELRQGMLEEAQRYIDEMYWNEDAALHTFMTSDRFWPNPVTAELHGLSLDRAQSAAFASERLGVLTLPGVLAVHSAFNESNPVLRAKFVLERLMCSIPPPPNFVVTAPVPDPTLTTRERWRAHSEIEACAACHAQLDPVGFALENFDGIGAYRTEENGRPIDASGGLPAAGIPDGDLEGGVELARAIADSPLFDDCFSRHWLRFVLGRLETDDARDGAALESMAARVATSSMQEATKQLLLTEAFRQRGESIDE